MGVPDTTVGACFAGRAVEAVAAAATLGPQAVQAIARGHSLLSAACIPTSQRTVHHSVMQAIRDDRRRVAH
jgi:hypothetical protein